MSEAPDGLGVRPRPPGPDISVEKEPTLVFAMGSAPMKVSCY